MNRTNYSAILFLTLSFGLLSFIASLSLGAADISFSDVISSLLASFSQEKDTRDVLFFERIIWELRMPRAILAFLAGCGLAVSGLILQTVTRNPLADPYLFGISSGASLGVVISIVLLGSTISVHFWSNFWTTLWTTFDS